MRIIRLISIVSLFIITIVNINCSIQDPISTQLLDNSLTADTLIISGITSFTYQIAPKIGGYDRLYIGSNNNYSFPMSLFKFANSGWETFSDSSIVIDSAFFQIYSNDSLIQDDFELKLYYSEDSIFNENESDMNYLNSIDLNNWQYLDLNTNVSSIIDTSDTSSSFQQSVIKWELDSTFMKILTDTSNSNIYRTFAVALGPNSTSEFLELLSREFSAGSLDPKIEIYYNNINSLDTLTRIYYVAEDISVLINEDINEISNDIIMLNRGSGLRSLINIPADSLLLLSNKAVIRYANLKLYGENDSLNSYNIVMDPVKENYDTSSYIFDNDPFIDLGTYYTNSNVINGELNISLKSYLQYLLIEDSLTSDYNKIGIKLTSSLNNSLFDTVKFNLDNSNNRLEILYVQ
tara:strand:+ start:177 stop:1394 length:1218 start_codon:yes stop_codon:yes gene_type:complete